MKLDRKTSPIMKVGTMMLFIIILAFLVRIIFAYAAPIKIWDETVYANLGVDLSHNLYDYSFTNGWSDYIPTSQGESYGYPNAGFRAPLLPYTIALLHIFQLGFLTDFIMPVIGTLSVFIVYLLGKELFNKNVGVMAAILFSLIPLHVLHSGKLLTDVLMTFFILLSVLSFWKGFEKGNNSFKVLFGVFLACALLSRYTALWIFPLFLIYTIVQGKLWKVLGDKFLWAGGALFFIILTPWLVYGLFTYNNPFGPFIHGSIASNYWGGVQSWHYFFNHWWSMFSLIGFAFAVALLYLLYKNALLKKELLLLLAWFVLFLGIAMYIPHKEERFLLPIAPTIALITAYAISLMKHHKTKIILTIAVASLFSVSTNAFAMYTSNHTIAARCYEQVGAKLKELQGDFMVVSENSSLFRFYAEHENIYYPANISENSLKTLEKSSNKKVLFVMTEYNSGFEEKKRNALITILDKNYDLVYECPQSKEINRLYLDVDTSGLQNLVPNNSFEDEESDYWVTNTSESVTTDKNNNGADPFPKNSAKMTGHTEEADLHTAAISVKQGGVYQFKVYVDAKAMRSGELGFLIDEYTSSNEWLRAKWVGNANPKTISFVSGLYSPTDPQVNTIRVHAYFAKSSKGTVYIDNYELFKIN